MEKLVVQDSIKNISNRFDLILTAAKIARQIQIKNKEMIFNSDCTHKCTVLALKEIEASLIFKKSFVL